LRLPRCLAAVRDHARALFVLAHLAALTLPGLPLPTYFDARSLDTPTGRDQLRLWASSLSAVGISTSDEGLRALVARTAPRLVSARRALLAPLAPYVEACGTRQAWRLFSFIDQELVELHVDVIVDGQVVPLYRPRSPSLRWRAEALDHERLRSVIATVSVSTWHRSTATLVAWLAAAALRDHPEATAARVGLFRRRTPTPAEARRGERPPGAYDPSWLVEREAPGAPP
jgi:hypothetical protein